MSDITANAFVRDALVAERPAPVKTTGLVGFLRTRLFNSPIYVLLTILGAARCSNPLADQTRGGRLLRLHHRA